MVAAQHTDLDIAKTWTSTLPGPATTSYYSTIGTVTSYTFGAVVTSTWTSTVVEITVSDADETVTIPVGSHELDVGRI